MATKYWLFIDIGNKKYTLSNIKLCNHTLVTSCRFPVLVTGNWKPTAQFYPVQNLLVLKNFMLSSDESFIGPHRITKFFLPE